MDQCNQNFKYLKQKWQRRSATCPPSLPFEWIINSKLPSLSGILNIDCTAYQPRHYLGIGSIQRQRRCSGDSCKKDFAKQCHTFLLEALRVGYFFEFLDLTPYPPRNPPFDGVACFSMALGTAHDDFIRTAQWHRATSDCRGQSWFLHDHCLCITLCFTIVTMNCKCSYIKMVPRGLEPRTLRLLAVRSNQLSYETHDVDRRHQVIQLLALLWSSNEDLIRRHEQKNNWLHRCVMSGMLMWVNAYNLHADHGCDASIDAAHDQP